MTMCENCEAATYRPSTFSAAGSPANLFRRLVGGKAQTIRGGCGPSSPAWWVRWESVTSLWRTCLASSVKGVPKSLLILPRWGSMRNGVLYLRPALVPRISGKESSLWVSPQARDWKGVTSANRHGASLPDQVAGTYWPTPTAVPYGNNQGGSMGRVGKVRHSLESMARNDLWPTPTASRTGDYTVDGRTGFVRRSLQGEAKIWPTPDASVGTGGRVRDPERVGPTGMTVDGKKRQVSLEDSVRRWPTPKSTISGSDYARAGREKSGTDDLVTAVSRTTGPGTPPTSLNPEWVEWLMGFPAGWTDLKR